MTYPSLGIFNREVPVWGYSINLGQAFISVLAIGAATVYTIKKIWQKSSAEREATNLSEHDFWAKVEATPTHSVENEPFSIGNTMFSNLTEAQKQMALSCKRTSEYVQKYLVDSDFKGTVLDLGSGIGANALPLVAKGCKVSIFERQEDVMSEYNLREMGLFFASSLSGGRALIQAKSTVGDITTMPYPENVHAVICVDTLPYLPPEQLKGTLQKIFQALRPGGQFIGTLFMKLDEKDNIFTDAMGKLGAHFYVGKSLAREIITRSGFQIKAEKERKDDAGFSEAHCFEFLAEKPRAT